MTRTGVMIIVVVLGVLRSHPARSDNPDDSDVGVDYLRSDVRCVDPSDVVGYRKCLPYANWSLKGPDVFVDVGMNVRHLTSPRRAPSSAHVAARSVGPIPEASQEGTLGLTFDERLGVRLGFGTYLAVEAELGTGLEPITTSKSSRELVIGGLAVAGVRGVIPFGSLAFEAAGGGRVIDETSDRDVESWDEGVLELRARGAFWLGPWVTLGVVAGASLVHEGEWMMGVFIGVDTYSYGGQR